MDDIFKIVFHVAGHAVVHGARAVAHGAAHGGAAVVHGAAHAASNSGRGATRLVGAVGRGAVHTAKHVGRSPAVRTVGKGATKATARGAKVASRGVKVGARAAHKGAAGVGKGVRSGAHVAKKGAVSVGKGGAHVAKKGAVVVGKGVKSGAHVANKGAVEVGKGIKSGAHVANKAAVAVGKEAASGAKVVGNVVEKPLKTTGKVAAAVATESSKVAVATAHTSARAAAITVDALCQPDYVYYGAPYHYRRNRNYTSRQHQTQSGTVFMSAPPVRGTTQSFPARVPLRYQAVSCDSVFVIHAGFIQKRGEKNTSFKKRFFVLTSEKKLYYKPGDTKAFPPEEFKKCRGVIDLSTVAAMNISPNNPLDFELVPVYRDISTGKKVQKRRYYKLRCETTNQRSSWLMAIEDTAQAGVTWLARMNYHPEGEYNAPTGSAAPPNGEFQPGSFAEPSAPPMPLASAPPMRRTPGEDVEGSKTVRSASLGEPDSFDEPLVSTPV